MRVTFDVQTDSMTIILNENPVLESDEEKPGIIIDYELEEGATHFWQDHIGAVETRVGAYLDKRLAEKPA